MPLRASSAVPAILNVACRVTGMGFAAIARVTESRWVCLAVHDEINFGLKRGGELKVETTLCREVRDSREVLVIDHVAEDDAYRGHQTPAMYGFQSYISMPIFLKDGSFFGTLCAIDPKPAKLNNPGRYRDVQAVRRADRFPSRCRSTVGDGRSQPPRRPHRGGIARAIYRRPRARSAKSAGIHRGRNATSATHPAQRKSNLRHCVDGQKRCAHVGAHR